MFYDPNEKIDTDFAPLPDGTYTFKVEKSHYGSNKKGDGEVMTVTLVATDEPYRGRKVWARFNVKNPSQQAQNIGKADMKDFLEAAGCGKKAMVTPDDFHKAVAGRSLRAEVVEDGKYNKIIGYGAVFIDAKRKAANDTDDLPF